MAKKLKFPLMVLHVEQVPFGEFGEEIELFKLNSRKQLKQLINNFIQLNQ